jgi:hypothetical protein
LLEGLGHVNKSLRAGAIPYFDIIHHELSGIFLREGERIWDFGTIFGLAKMSVSNSRQTNWVRRWAGDEAFELFDQIESGSIDIGSNALPLLKRRG